MLDLVRLEALGLDTGEGILFCAEDPEFYEEMLLEYVDAAPSGAEELSRCARERDWQGYVIRAHSIKNTSRLIGARALSELAREQEAAAKTGDASAVLPRHESFLRSYQELAAAIQEALP